MKTELATSIFVAILGTVVAYFVCNMFLNAPEDVTLKTLSSNLTYTLTEPNSEIFNFRAVNPTVEVYVGQCQEYDDSGQCMEESDATTD